MPKARIILFLLLTAAVCSAAAVPNLLLEHAIGLYNEGEYAKAKELYLRYSAEDNPTNANVWFNIGACEKGLSNYSNALAAYQKAFRLNSNDYEALYFAGMMHGRLGRTNRMIEAVQRALLFTKDEGLKTNFRHKLSEIYSDLGYSYSRSLDYDKMRWAFTESLKLNKENVDALSLLAKAYIKQGDYEKAMEILEAAEGIDPESFMPPLYMCYAYAMLKDVANCLKSAKECMELKPEHEQYVHLYKSILFFRIGNNKAGFELLDKALEADELDPALSYAADIKDERGFNKIRYDERFSYIINYYFFEKEQ